MSGNDLVQSAIGVGFKFLRAIITAATLLLQMQ